MICKVCKKQETGNSQQKKCNSCLDYWSNYIPSFRIRWAATIVKDAKRRAIQKGLPFSITTDYIYSIMPKTAHCPYLNEEFQLPIDGIAGPMSITLDRIAPELGYVEGNVQLVSKLANEMLSSASPAQLTNFCKLYLATTIR